MRQTSALKFVRLLMLFAVCVTAQCLAGQLALAEPAQCSETAVEGDRCFSDASAEDEFDSGDGADDLPYLGFNADRCERASRLEQKLSVPAHGSFADRFPYRVPAVRAPPLIA